MIYTAVEDLKGAIEYTKEDYKEGLRPYEYLASIKNPFIRDREINRLNEHATSQGVRGFKNTFKQYMKAQKSISADSEGNYTEFSEIDICLCCGIWTADDSGIRRSGLNGEEYACRHPILIKERLINVDTGVQAITILFRQVGSLKWREVTVDKETIANARQIVSLAKYGILVTSESARLLVQYLMDLEAYNADIPEKKSVGRLGNIPGEGFSPYVDDLIFDGDASFRQLFQAVKSKGKMDEWKKVTVPLLKHSIAARIMLMTSFASVMVEPLGCLPFFTHVWGVDSGTGKTVGLMLAASVWGDPDPGVYIKTFNSTQVGMEKTAAFLNNLPLCLDEMQLNKDRFGKSYFSPYALAEGVAKVRGTKTGGVESVLSWRNSIITTGESPLVGESAGAGAVNRVVNVEVESSSPVIPAAGNKIANTLRANYGHAGRIFVEKLYNNLDLAKEMYDAGFAFFQNFTTEKQAMSAALIIAADWLCITHEWLFSKGEVDKGLDGKELLPYLADPKTVSAGERGYQYLVSWVAENAAHFEKANSNILPLYGINFEANSEVYIIKSIYNKVMQDAGYDPSSVLSWMKSSAKITHTLKNERTFRARINGILTTVIAFKLPKDND